MIKNYFKTAFRNLWRNKTFSVIKILGLSIGLAVCMLILLYTKDELSYDQFHKNKAQIFRVIQNLKFGADAPQTIGITTPTVGETFAAEIPEVKQFVRINGESVTIKKKNNDVLTEQCMFVDNNFFTVFSFRLLEGNKRTALKDPHSVVLSKKTAIKYFGTDDAVGETLQIKKGDEFENYTVSAIAENPPQNSSIKADLYIQITAKSLLAPTPGWAEV
jgi:putative ABC transport system permease protein